MIDPTPAINRGFRLYFTYCKKWDQDALFSLLEALHSLDDKLSQENKHPMLTIPEYVALKAIRNHFHHAEEIRNVMASKVSKACCSRATRDLAVVMFVADIPAARAKIEEAGLFEPDDIVDEPTLEAALA